MKRKFTLLVIFLVGALVSQAFPGSSRLHLNLFDDGQFVVTVNGQKFYNVQGHLTVNGLDPGTHRIRVVEQFFGRRGRPLGRNVLYVGSINIPFRSAVFAHLNPNNQLRVREIRQLPNQRRFNQRDLRRGPDVIRGRGQDGFRGYGNRAPDFRNNRGIGRRGPNNWDNRGNRGVVRGNARAFQTLIFTLRGTSFDRDRLVIARQYTRNNRVTSAQVAEIMRMFSFESTRLTYAQDAWHDVLDPENYFLVNRSFTFSSSTRRLDRYINGGGR